MKNINFIFSLIPLFFTCLFAKDLPSQVKVQNRPPYVNNKDLVVAGYPGSSITITLNAIDPEGKGVFTVLKNKNIGDGIICNTRNAIQIICKIPNITLSEKDNCYVNTIEGKTPIPYCKEYTIDYYLKDNGYQDLPSATSDIYHIALRVVKDINNTVLIKDYRAYGNSLKGNFAVSNYNVNNIASILPKNMQ
jgi:hypothetical protein